MTDLKRTPLFEFHSKHGARFVPFGGWEMPVQYKGIKEEHQCVREAAGLFDVSHMGQVRIQGPEAGDLLNTIVTNDVSRLKDGRGQYSPMCYDHGGVVDDLIYYRLAEDEYLLVVNASNKDKDYGWIQEHTEPFDCEIVDESDSWALLALQGPEAEAILSKVVTDDLSAISRFGLSGVESKEALLLVARTGYTGEAGFEIFCPAEASAQFADQLYKAGEGSGMQLAGLGCRDSLRLEAGYPLYGHEISESIDPLSGGIGWTVKFNKTHDFLGKAALEEHRDRGLETSIHYFIVEDRRMARQNMPVMDGDREVGRVVSGAFSPVLNQPIGSALIAEDSSQSENLAIESRGKRMPIRLKKPPLHR